MDLMLQALLDRDPLIVLVRSESGEISIERKS